MKRKMFLVMGLERYLGSPSCTVYRTFRASNNDEVVRKMKGEDIKHLKYKKLFQEVKSPK